MSAVVECRGSGWVSRGGGTRSTRGGGGRCLNLVLYMCYLGGRLVTVGTLCTPLPPAFAPPLDGVHMRFKLLVLQPAHPRTHNIVALPPHPVMFCARYSHSC